MARGQRLIQDPARWSRRPSGLTGHVCAVGMCDSVCSVGACACGHVTRVCRDSRAAVSRKRVTVVAGTRAERLLSRAPHSGPSGGTSAKDTAGRTIADGALSGLALPRRRLPAPDPRTPGPSARRQAPESPACRRGALPRADQPAVAEGPGERARLHLQRRGRRLPGRVSASPGDRGGGQSAWSCQSPTGRAAPWGHLRLRGTWVWLVLCSAAVRAAAPRHCAEVPAAGGVGWGRGLSRHPPPFLCAGGCGGGVHGERAFRWGRPPVLGSPLDMKTCVLAPPVAPGAP